MNRCVSRPTFLWSKTKLRVRLDMANLGILRNRKSTSDKNTDF